MVDYKLIGIIEFSTHFFFIFENVNIINGSELTYHDSPFGVPYKTSQPNTCKDDSLNSNKNLTFMNHV